MKNDLKTYTLFVLSGAVIALVLILRKQQAVEEILAESHMQLEEWLNEVKGEAI